MFPVNSFYATLALRFFRHTAISLHNALIQGLDIGVRVHAIERR